MLVVDTKVDTMWRAYSLLRKDPVTLARTSPIKEEGVKIVQGQISYWRYFGMPVPLIQRNPASLVRYGTCPKTK